MAAEDPLHSVTSRQSVAARACHATYLTPTINMATRNFRLFVICVMIVTSIIEPPVSAFTIRRNAGPVERVDDLVAEESSMYEARTDKARANKIRVTTNRGSRLEKALPALRSAKVIEIKGDPTIEDNVELTTAFLLLKTDHGLFKITGLPIYTSDATSLPSQTPTDLPFDTSEFLRDRREKGTRNDTTTTNTNDSITTTLYALKLSSPETTTSESSNTKFIPYDDTTIEGPTAEGDIKIDAATFTTTDISPTTTDIDNTKIGGSATSKTKTPGEISATASEAISVASASPPWKKYTTIDRKRLGSAAQSTISSEITREIDTEPTRINLGKLLSESPIQSLEKLGADLLSDLNTTKTPIQSELETSSLPVVKESVENTPEITSSVYTSSPITKPSSLRTLHLTSMRAGFLDYSAKPIAEEATTIIENFDTVSKINESELLAASFVTESREPDTSPESKNDTGVESQSQLAEDAINEELMREEMLSNNAENSRYRKEGDSKLTKTEVVSDKTTVSDFGQDTPGEDLSVKPIEKNSALYTVSSNNYKPLKKIEIQPLKPFVRDPDDNSWRNESLSSLGIVFKAKSPSKNYTQVLKNKTVILFNNSLEKDNKSGVPDLRERLEKIAEVRKSKKKKVIDKFGDTVYSDYEEAVNSAETTSASSPTLETTSAVIPQVKIITKYVHDPEVTTYVSLLDQLYEQKIKNLESVTTPKPKKYNGILEYYDTTDEYDAEYVNLPKIDLKKYTSHVPPTQTKDTPVTTAPIPTSQFTKPITNYWPDRKPTLQYFPPLSTQKVNVNGYDNDFVRKVNYYAHKDNKNTNPAVHATLPTPPASPKYELYKENTIKPADFTRLYRPANVENNGYVAHHQRPAIDTQQNGYVDANDGNYNRATYVIKHYKDFIDAAAKDVDYDKNIEYETDAYTRQPLRGVTLDELARAKNQNKQTINGDYDHDAQFRKDILHRFVDNFNQNSERFKVDFPILYNNSVVHRTPEESGKVVATSSTFVKRLYDEQSNANTATRTNDYLIRRPCDHCDNYTVELAPAYELHYYVPDQEEKEEADPRATIPYRYRL